MSLFSSDQDILDALSLAAVQSSKVLTRPANTEVSIVSWDSDRDFYLFLQPFECVESDLQRAIHIVYGPADQHWDAWGYDSCRRIICLYKIGMSEAAISNHARLAGYQQCHKLPRGDDRACSTHPILMSKLIHDWHRSYKRWIAENDEQSPALPERISSSGSLIHSLQNSFCAVDGRNQFSKTSLYTDSIERHHQCKMLFCSQRKQLQLQEQQTQTQERDQEQEKSRPEMLSNEFLRDMPSRPPGLSHQLETQQTWEQLQHKLYAPDIHSPLALEGLFAAPRDFELQEHEQCSPILNYPHIRGRDVESSYGSCEDAVTPARSRVLRITESYAQAFPNRKGMFRERGEKPPTKQPADNRDNTRKQPQTAEWFLYPDYEIIHAKNLAPSDQGGIGESSASSAQVPIIPDTPCNWVFETCCEAEIVRCVAPDHAPNCNKRIIRYSNGITKPFSSPDWEAKCLSNSFERIDGNNTWFLRWRSYNGRIDLHPEDMSHRIKPGNLAVDIPEKMAFLDHVLVTFHNRPDIHRKFIKVLKDLLKGSINVAWCMSRIKLLFKDDLYLMDGFKVFLPECREQLVRRPPKLEATGTFQGGLSPSPKTKISLPVTKAEDSLENMKLENLHSVVEASRILRQSDMNSASLQPQRQMDEELTKWGNDCSEDAKLPWGSDREWSELESADEGWVEVKKERDERVIFGGCESAELDTKGNGNVSASVEDFNECFV